jgi:hypothetical protein
MIKLDGIGFSKFGIRGLLCTDAAASVLMFAVVAAVFVVCGLSLRRIPDEQTKARPTFIS